MSEYSFKRLKGKCHHCRNSLVGSLLLLVATMVTASSLFRPLYGLSPGLLYCTTLLHFGDCCWLILVSWAFFSGLDQAAAMDQVNSKAGIATLFRAKIAWRHARARYHHDPLRIMWWLFIYLLVVVFYSQTPVNIFHFFFLQLINDRHPMQLMHGERGFEMNE